MERAIRQYVYRLDAANNIIDVNSDWLAFARENGLRDWTPTTVAGRPLMHFIADKETRHLYELLLDKVRRTQRAVSIPFRCDSPAVRRFMELCVLPSGNDQVEIRGVLLREEPRPPVALLDESEPRSETMVTICGWCKRVRVFEQWLEVEDAVTRLGLFDSKSLPQLTHGICPQCQAMVLRQIDEA